MNSNITATLTILVLTLTGGLTMGPVSAADSKGHIVGLALHQETGRNIYLGALRATEPRSGADKLLQVGAVQVMEQRIVARRTSIRNLLGNLLLQGELASGHAPGPGVLVFVDDVITAVRGSLYAGDSLEIMRSENDTVAAYLNGFQMGSSDDTEIFGYLLMAWLGETGPSSAFRQSILSPKIDAALLSVYDANTASGERLAAVGTWAESVAGTLQAVTEETDSPQPPIDTGETAPKTEPVVVASTVASAMTTTAHESAPPVTATVSATSVSATSVSTTSVSTTPVMPPPKKGTDNDKSLPAELALPVAEPTLQMASVTLPESTLVDSASDIQALDIDVMEYSHRLAVFNTDLIKRVYTKIRYPKSAVRRNIQGVLELDITLRQDGSLVAVAVAQSSGFTMLDKSALRAANTALADNANAELDPVAIEEYTGEDGHLVIPIPVSFVLTE